MPDGTWRLIDMDGAVVMGKPIGAKALSTAFMPPETTRVQGEEVVFRVQKHEAEALMAHRPLMAHPTLDIWSFAVVLFRAIAHRPLIEADDRDNLRSKREAMILAKWGPRYLSDALMDAQAALIADGASAIERLVACNLLGWGLQPKPADRPQSCEEMLAHSFFTAMEEQKGDGATVVTEAQVLELTMGLKLTTRVHIAAELGEQDLTPTPPVSAAATRRHIS